MKLTDCIFCKCKVFLSIMSRLTVETAVITINNTDGKKNSSDGIVKANIKLTHVRSVVLLRKSVKL